MAANYHKQHQFLQIDMGNVTKVTRIATQGTSDKNWWTKTFTLDYSQDGVTFISYNNSKVLVSFRKAIEVLHGRHTKYSMRNIFIAPALQLAYLPCKPLY